MESFLEERRVMRKRKKRRGFLLPFFLSLSIVLLMGTIVLSFFYWKKNTAGGDLTAEIPEKIEYEAEVKPENIFDGIKGEEKEEVRVEEPTRYGHLLEDTENLKKNKIYPLSAKDSEKVTMSFGGDILFDANYSIMTPVKQSGGDITAAFSEEILEEMHSADIFMLNNEFTYTNRGEPIEGKQYTFRAKPETAQYLKTLGVDAVSLANNHAYDYGEISLMDTLETLEELDMPYTGAGRNLEEASKPITFLVNDLKIAIISATQIERLDNPDTKGATESSPGVFRCWNPEKLYQVIEETKAESDFVVVYIHWGTEGTAELDWAQTTQVTKIVESGADLIVGDHPHCLQEIAFVGGVPVIYSLGNFWFNSKTQDTCIVKVEVSENGLESFRFIPAVQEKCRTRLAEGEEKKRILDYMRSISKNAAVDEEGGVTEKG